MNGSESENGHVLNMDRISSCSKVEDENITREDEENKIDYDSDESNVKDLKKDNCCARGMTGLRRHASSAIPPSVRRNSGCIVKILIISLYFVYFGFAMALSFGDEGSVRLIACTVLGVLLLSHKLLWRKLGPVFGKWTCSPKDKRRVACSMRVIRWFLYILTGGFMLVFLIVEVGMKNPRNLVSLGGLAFFILAAFFFSRKPAQVNWHTVYWGMTLQFLLALFILRTKVGASSVLWMTNRVNELLANAEKGSEFMFGKSYRAHGLIFGSLPVIFFVNSLVGVLYYLGAIQWFVDVVGRFLKRTLGISPAESICVATNILIDFPSTGMAMKPYIEPMSNSELYTMLVAGQASVSGAFLALIASFGISVGYLITACILSAPASIVISKLVYPDSGKGTKSENYGISLKGRYRSLNEAASIGAISSMSLFGSIAVSLYVYYGLLSFINSTLRWFGERVNIADLSFELICSYVLLPLPAIMGADIGDCGNIGKLIGYKVMGSASLSYIKLATLVGNRKVFQDYMHATNGTGSYQYIGQNLLLDSWNRTLEFGYMSEKSEAIATYALCGLSNFTSIGLSIAIFHTLIPQRKRFVAKHITQSMLWANVACFMTACFAGLFF